MTMQSSIKSFSEKTEKKMNMIAKKAIIDLCSDIISNTPVDTGRLKNNWFPSVDSPSDETTPELSPEDKKKGKKIPNKATMRLKNFVSQNYDISKVFYFTNNMPYAYRIEYEGYSGQAPEGMVRKNIIRWSKYFDRS